MKAITNEPVSGGSAPQQQALPLIVKLFYALPQMPIMMTFLPIGMFLPQFYTGERGIDLADFANIVLFVSVFDIITDPLMGWISDKTQTRFGRRRPWIILGVPLMMLGIYKLFLPGDAVITSLYLIGWMALLRLGWTMVTIPYSAWGAEITGDYNERTSIAGWRAALGAFGAIAIQVILVIALLGFNFGGSENALWLVGQVVICLLPICVGLAAFFVPENTDAPATSLPILKGLKIMWRNGPFKRIVFAFLVANGSFAINTQLFVFFVAYVIGDMQAFVWILLYANICSLISIPVWLKISQRIGKHRAWIGGFLMIAVSGPFFMLLGNGDLLWMIPIVTVGAFGSATYDALPSSMKADIIDIDTLRTGQERTAWFFAVWLFTTKISMALAGWFALRLLDFAGFNPMLGAENGPDEILALKLIFGVLPSILILLAIKIVWRYPVTQERHASLRAALERRNKVRFASKA